MHGAAYSGLVISLTNPKVLKKRVVLVMAASALASLSLPCSPAFAQDFSETAKTSDFKTFIQDFESNYAYLDRPDGPDRPDKPWLTWEARYSSAVEHADSKQAFDAVLASALSELHDFHAEVRSPVNDRWLPVPTFADLWAEFTSVGAIVTAVRQGSDAERAGVHVGDKVTQVGPVPLDRAIADRLTPAVDHSNPQARQWALLSVLTGRSDEVRTLSLVNHLGASYTVNLPVERRLDRAPGELATQLLPGNIGLIRFNNSLGEQKTVEVFDAALTTLRNTRGLILDLRDVPSGAKVP